MQCNAMQCNADIMADICYAFIFMNRYYLFGVQCTLIEMLVIAIMIWATIAAIIFYYVDYLK
jgi:uncharacterized membrane protein (GlpM family)